MPGRRLVTHRQGWSLTYGCSECDWELDPVTVVHAVDAPVPIIVPQGHAAAIAPHDPEHKPGWWERWFG